MRLRRVKPVHTVTGTVRDINDDIVALTGPWGTTSESDVLANIRDGSATYVVYAPDGRRHTVSVRRGATAEFLWVSWGEETFNNLDDLPRRTAHRHRMPS